MAQQKNISGVTTQELLAAGDNVKVSSITITNTHASSGCYVSLYIAKKLVVVNDNDLDQQKFLHGCQFYGIRPFTTGEAQNNWERRFLRDMRRRIVRLERPTPKQCDSLINILQRRNDVLLGDNEVHENG